MTPNRERTYEAIYAAAFVRELSSITDMRLTVGRELVRYAHERAEWVAKRWLEMVQAAEGNGGDV